MTRFRAFSNFNVSLLVVRLKRLANISWRKFISTTNFVDFSIEDEQRRRRRRREPIVSADIDVGFSFRSRAAANGRERERGGERKEIKKKEKKNEKWRAEKANG